MYPVVFEKKIAHLLKENFVYARALHYLGINFFDATEKTLNEVCAEYKISQQDVVKKFYEFDSNNRITFKNLEKHSLLLLSKYLRQCHQGFVKERIPFIILLLKNTNYYARLKLMILEAIEAFITHIYDEEDTIMSYIELLHCISVNQASFGELLLTKKFQDISLVEEKEKHMEEDEFAEIRELLANTKPDNLFDSILQKEVWALDREMLYHSEIENKIYFPKAIKIESLVKEKLYILSQLN